MDKRVQNAVGKVVFTLIKSRARRAAKYISPGMVVRASRKVFRGKIEPDSWNHVEVILTIGRPNHRQRQFIKLCQKAGEEFPVKKIQLQYPAKKRKK